MSPCARDFYIMTLASEHGDAFGGCAAVPAFFATILYGIKAYKLIKAIYEDIKNSERSDLQGHRKVGAHTTIADL